MTDDWPDLPAALVARFRDRPDVLAEHRRQLAGGVPLPRTERPPAGEVWKILRRQKRCPQLTKSGCRCYCAKLDRRPDVWQDCRECPELPESR